MHIYIYIDITFMYTSVFCLHTHSPRPARIYGRHECPKRGGGKGLSLLGKGNVEVWRAWQNQLIWRFNWHDYLISWFDAGKKNSFCHHWVGRQTKVQKVSTAITALCLREGIKTVILYPTAYSFDRYICVLNPSISQTRALVLYNSDVARRLCSWGCG